MKKQRTPSEIIAETEARLERLRLRQASTEAKNDPAVAALIAQRDSLIKQMNGTKKLLGTGPQSGQTRIDKHQIWIDQISRQMGDARAALDNFEVDLHIINERITAAIQGVVSPKNMSAEG